MTRGPIARLAVVFVGLCLVCIAWASFGFLPFSRSTDDSCPGYVATEENGSINYGVTAWPPGAIKCHYTTPAGEAAESTVVPWSDWYCAMLFAAALTTAAAAALGIGRRAIASVLAIVLGVTSWIVLFAGALYATLFGAIGIAVALSVGRGGVAQGKTRMPRKDTTCR